MSSYASSDLSTSHPASASRCRRSALGASWTRKARRRSATTLPFTPGQRRRSRVWSRAKAWVGGGEASTKASNSCSPPRFVYERGVSTQPSAGDRGGGVIDEERAQIGARAAQQPAQARVGQPRGEVAIQNQILRLPHARDLARGAPHAAHALQRQAVAHVPHVPQDERGEVLVRLERRAAVRGGHGVRAWSRVLGVVACGRASMRGASTMFKIRREFATNSVLDTVRPWYLTVDLRITHPDLLFASLPRARAPASPSDALRAPPRSETKDHDKHTLRRNAV